MHTFPSLRSTLLLPGLAAALAFTGAAALAADQSQPSEPQYLAQSEQFSDDDVKAFVAARESVIEISREWEERIQNAENQEEMNSLQQASQEEMVRAIEAEGLTVNDYNVMVDAARSNPDLQQRINELIAE